nr:MAG TPA: hypothetical protein [Caudoviricetes sp.]
MPMSTNLLMQGLEPYLSYERPVIPKVNRR